MKTFQTIPQRLHDWRLADFETCRIIDGGGFIAIEPVAGLE